MGEYNSSCTRVVPVFDALMDRDLTGRSWLPTLLKLGSRSPERIEGVVAGSLIANHRRWWGDEERKLNPPMSLLRWLVQNLNKPASERLWGSGKTKRYRELLVAKDPETIILAINLLEEMFKSSPKETRPRAWYVLEGRSQPDAFLETENLVVVIEGKRTERHATTTTTWMPKRSQILRHMDAAWEIREGKPVLGLMIIEGSDHARGLEPSPYWLGEANSQIVDEMLKSSLPHRTAKERIAIADGFLGVVTWQRVCQEFHLPWPPELESPKG